MKVQKIQSQNNFKSVSLGQKKEQDLLTVRNSDAMRSETKTDSIQPVSDNKSIKKESFTDKFSTRIKNSADLNDCVSVPRSVFKGYLAFMLGTAALTLGAFIPQKAKKVKNFILVAGNLVNLFGIWSFVRPYIVKDAAPTVKGGQR